MSMTGDKASAYLSLGDEEFRSARAQVRANRDSSQRSRQPGVHSPSRDIEQYTDLATF